MEKNGLRNLLPLGVQRAINGYILLVAVVASLLLIFAIRDFFSPAFHLQKEDWTCSLGHYPLQEGQAPSPSRGPVHVPQGSWICDRYERRVPVK